MRVASRACKVGEKGREEVRLGLLGEVGMGVGSEESGRGER